MSAIGFAPSITQDVRVSVSEAQAVVIRLSIPSTQTSVDVRATHPIAKTESSTIGGLIDGEAITSLPLGSRNYTQILGLPPSVIADLTTVTTLGNGTQNVAAQGFTPLSNNIQFNGIDANNLLENSAADAQNYETGTAIPTPDAIEEFRVQTANYDAGYGRGPGANIDIVSRTSTN